MTLRTVALGLVLVLSGTAVQAAPRNPDVRHAVADYEALSYGNVIPLLVKALNRPELSEPDRRTALAYLARTYAIFKRQSEAESTFVELLERDPSFAPADSESPRIREAFQAAKLRRVVSQPAPIPPPTPPQGLVTTPPPEPNRTWLWVGAGAGVVVAAAVTVLLIVRPWDKDEPRRSGELETWVLP